MAEKKEKAIEQDFNEEVYEMLAGYVDEEGTVHKEFQVKEITGVEEEAISKTGIKENGSKVVRTLLEKCVTRIGVYENSKIPLNKWRSIIQSLTVGDQDFILLKIREETFGKEIETYHKCPSCKAELNAFIDVDELKIIPFNGEREFEFELPKGYKDKNGKVHKIGKLRYPNGHDREILDNIARKNLGTANTMLLTRCITDFGEVKVHDKIVREMSIRDREYLLNLLKENAFGIDLETTINCSNCGEEFTTTLNVVNFL